MGYLRPATIASHAATLVAVLVALLSKDQLSSNEQLAIKIIGGALPIMVLGFVLAPVGLTNDPTLEKFYLWIHPLAHLVGIFALASVFRSVSEDASIIFLLVSLICLGVLVWCHRKIMERPAVKEAYERVEKAKRNKA